MNSDILQFMKIWVFWDICSWIDAFWLSGGFGPKISVDDKWDTSLTSYVNLFRATLVVAKGSGGK
jgi:hypothetical protein